MLDRLSVALFKLRIQADTPLVLPIYKGSTFRGGFGHAFKKVVCLAKGVECKDCLLRNQCAYSYIFETPLPPDSQIMRKYPQVPHPFVLIPPLGEERIYKKGDEIFFGLTLIGKAIEYLPYFIFTFEELGKIGIGKNKGKFSLNDVFTLDSNCTKKLIYEKTQKKLLSLYETSFPFKIRNDGINGKRLKLCFLTPVRVKYAGSFGNKLEFHILIRNLLRRISTLAYFHCGEEQPDIDFKYLIEKAKNVKIDKSNLKWYEWQRYSSKQDTRMSMGGFIGDVVYMGDLDEFIPWLKAGELVHVGKGTSFGLGKYQLKNLEE